MNPWYILAGLAFLSACTPTPVTPPDDEADADTDADTDSDTDADTDSDTDADTDADTDSDTDSDTDTDADADTPNWSGTWEVEVAYHYTCEGWGNVESHSGVGNWALSLTGDPDDLTATVNGNDWYTMNGTGDEEELFLCGSFPMIDPQGDAATSGNDNNLCLKGDEVVNAELVYGEMTGTFVDSFGSDCAMDASPIVLSD